MQATQLAVTNFTTGNNNGVNPETFNFPVTLSDTSQVLTPGGGGETVTATIPVQSTATTIYIGFSNGDGTGSAIGNLDYEVVPSAANNSYFTTGAPVELVIPAGQTSGSFELFGTGGGIGPSTLQVNVDQVNLAAPAGVTNKLNITIVTPIVSIENGVGFETGVNSGFVTIPVRLSNALPIAETVTYSTVTIAPVTGTIQATAGTFSPETNQTITFNPGQIVVDIEIPLSGVTVPQAEVFGVEIVNLTAGFTAFPNPSTAYILNAQPTLDVGPTVTFASTPATFASNGGTATFTATLSAANATQDTVIVLNYTPQGAVEGTDYTTTGDVVVIPKGTTTGTVTMTGNNENAGSFVISTTAPQIFGASLGSPLPTLSFTEKITGGTSFSGGGVTIEGFVTDNKGNPMPGVYVYVGTPLANDAFDPNNAAYEGNGFFNYYVTTDANGFYEFTGLPFFGTTTSVNYTVSELVPANYVETEPTGNQYTVAVSFSQTTGFTYTTKFVSGGAAVTATPGPILTDFTNSPPGPPSPTARSVPTTSSRPTTTTSSFTTRSAEPSKRR